MTVFIITNRVKLLFLPVISINKNIMDKVFLALANGIILIDIGMKVIVRIDEGLHCSDNG
ncbi:hypothetical protein D3C73_965910 [compost metagenome]